MYLGDKISKYPFKNGVVALIVMSLSQYVHESVKNTEMKYLSELNMSLPGKANTPSA